MASRVNTSFVVGLAAVLLALAGLAAFVGYKAMRKSGDDYIRLADQALAAQDYENAVKYLARAVNKDQRNVQWIQKWMDAMEKSTPNTQQDYEDRYFGQYRSALRALADAERTKVENFQRVLDEQLLTVRLTGGALAQWESLAKTTDDLLKLYRGDETGKGLIRRYRGIAVQNMARLNPDTKFEQRDAGYQDLTAALAAGPGDEDACISAAAMEMAFAQDAEKQRNPEESKKWQETSRGRLVKFAADHPPAPFANLQLVLLDLVDAASEAARTNKPNQLPTQVELMLARQDRIKEIADALDTVKPSDVDPLKAVDFAIIMAEALPKGPVLAFEFLDRIRDGRPMDRAILLLGEAKLAHSKDDFDKSETYFQQVLDLPPMPLSLQGALLKSHRMSAISDLGTITFQRWRASNANAEREKFAARADELRKLLVAAAGENAYQVMALDAYIAFMRSDFMGARALATRYNDQTDRRDSAMLDIEAEILRRMGNTGAAKDTYLRILQLQPTDLRTILYIADIEAAAGNWSEAGKYYAQADMLRPNDPAIIERRDMAKQLALGEARDPVWRALQKANETANGVARDLPGAVAILRAEQEKHPGERRLALALKQLYVALGDIEAARSIIDEAVAVNPDDTGLTDARDELAKTDRVAATSDLIDNAPIPEWQRDVMRHDLLSKTGDSEGARAALDRARSAAPEDPNVVEACFQDAVSRKDLADAEKYVVIAERRNLDQVGGQLFRARLDIVKKNYEAAARALRQVVAQDKLNVLGWRLLGMVQMETGDDASAAEALSKAVAINSSDIVTSKAYIKVLLKLHQEDKALAYARQVETAAGSDTEFSEMLLQMEAGIPGGSKERAISIRTRLMERDPGNTFNRAVLAALLIKEKRFEEAKPIVSEIRKDPMDILGVQLEAEMLGLQRNTVGAIKVLQDYINAIPEEKRDERPYIDGSRVLADLNLIDAAVAFLETGRKYQDPKLLSIDRELGDLLFNAARYDAAVKVYKRLLEKTDANENLSVLKRVLESLLRQKQYASMDEIIIAQNERVQKDATLLLLAAECAAGQGDRAKARRLYDQAIALSPRNAATFLKRADFNRADVAMLRDVEQDYMQVLAIDSRANIARARLGALYVETGRIDQAIDQFKQAVQIDPTDDQIRNAYIDLLVQRGRSDDAIGAIDEIVKLRPGEPSWLLKAATLAVRAGRFDKASEYYGQVWRMQPIPEFAYYYATALLSKNLPDVAAAGELLSNPVVKSDQTILMCMVRARWNRLQKKTLESSDQVRAALAIVDQSKPDDVGNFLAGMDGVYTTAPEVITALNNLEGKAPFKEWMALHANRIRLRMAENEPQVRSSLAQLAESATSKKVQAAAWAILGSMDYSLEKWESAAEYFRKGMELEPENPELLNNFAYLAATRLNRLDDALKAADKAVSIEPDNSGYTDTLATIYFLMKKYDKAADLLGQAISLCRNDQERGPVFLHMSQVRLAMGNRAEARAKLLLAETAFQNAPAGTTANYKDDLKQLHKALDGQ